MKLTLINYFLIVLILNTNFLFSQKVDSSFVRGTVQESATGNAVPFAGIFIKGTIIGTISDSLGNFKLNIPKSKLKDTLIVSSVGYSTYKQNISYFKNLKKVEIYLSDSIYLLDEVIAIAYDYFETFKWQSKRKGVEANYLTFSTDEIDNVSNFIKVMRGQFGKSKEKGSLYQWKKANIPNIGKRNKISLKYFTCPYCPGDDDITVTILIKDDHGKMPLNDEMKEELLENYFQGILDKTFDLGVDFTQLAKRDGKYYKKNSVEPYTGKCFGYFKNGQIGLKGHILNGLKNEEWMYWYSNSRKKMLVHFSMGKKSGNWKYWYDNGKPRINSNYENNKMVGKNTWWYENGQLKKVSVYKNGVFIAKVEWNSKGKIIEKIGTVD
jgi:antitoxin component YwqK of YwqJK toxin-antitoxin module